MTDTCAGWDRHVVSMIGDMCWIRLIATGGLMLSKRGN